MLIGSRNIALMEQDNAHSSSCYSLLSHMSSPEPSPSPYSTMSSVSSSYTTPSTTTITPTTNIPLHATTPPPSSFSSSSSSMPSPSQSPPPLPLPLSWLQQFIREKDEEEEGMKQWEIFQQQVEQSREQQRNKWRTLTIIDLLMHARLPKELHILRKQVAQLLKYNWWNKSLFRSFELRKEVPSIFEDGRKIQMLWYGIDALEKKERLYLPLYCIGLFQLLLKMAHGVDYVDEFVDVLEEKCMQRWQEICMNKKRQDAVLTRIDV